MTTCGYRVTGALTVLLTPGSYLSRTRGPEQLDLQLQPRSSYKTLLTNVPSSILRTAWYSVCAATRLLHNCLLHIFSLWASLGSYTLLDTGNPAESPEPCASAVPSSLSLEEEEALLQPGERQRNQIIGKPRAESCLCH